MIELHESYGPDHSAPLRPRAASAAGAQSTTVFVIDDNIAIRESIGDTLKENPDCVEHFSDCSAFL